ncbi:Uu.00g043040.m01.CDS01 [Anthostomella pinea]|uniref:Uu.00g043040.m01.CDS01 n=1 Tax=Anthostomella pinea TaxID=933095 RepID=A0AAI8YE36_9PEZI|nr:Uu.00g043040.m01.CDS01 [Anthostomella pinea]
MESPAPETTAVPPIVFRGKKRKFYRQRAEAEDNRLQAVAPSEQETATPQTQGSPTPDTVPASGDGAAEEGLSVAEALRLRNARKSKLRGVKFSADNARGDVSGGGFDDDDELSRMIREEQSRALELSSSGVNKRFAAQTGMVGELVNKHMEEYIEAELAKRHSSATASSSQAAVGSSSSSNSQANNTTRTTTEPTGVKKPDRHIALQGKLMEIDLGDEARSRNEAMTERARRKLQGEAIEDEEQQVARPKKVRLGRDGKPWRSRNRRNSDAIKRDQLVEEILRENRLDVYEIPTPPCAVTAGPDEEDGAADDRIAEEFRREFMDAMAQRQQKKKAPAPPAKPGAKKDEEVLKGPKLGGSRNMRAAMRDLLLKKERESKK